MHCSRDMLVVHSVPEIARNYHLICAIAFGFQARLPGGQLVQRLRNDGQISPRLDVVEAKQDLPSLDLLAVADTQFTHHAASRVLHALDVAINHHLARGNDGARELRGDGPPADADHEKRGYGSDQTDMKRQ